MEGLTNAVKPEWEHLLPEEIEKRSFEILSGELERMGGTLRADQAPFIKRVIHTTEDFSYADTLAFSPDAPAVLKGLLRSGADIVTDTNMALSGISRRTLARFGGQAHCFMADEDVARLAKERKTTRAAVSMEKARGISKPVIFAVGNAPTALLQLNEMMREGGWRPAFIIGVPVGFVNVEAAKELILEGTVPYIVNKGRKGGSGVAAAICNAALYECAGEADGRKDTDSAVR